MVGRKAIVYWQDRAAGRLSEEAEGYAFEYFEAYRQDPAARAISFTLPLAEESFISRTMFPFFDGLIPEGWLLDVAVHSWKLDPRDRMGLLMTCWQRDC